MINAITSAVHNTIDYQLITAINSLILSKGLADKHCFYVVKVKANIL